ncbi:MAG: GAF domain-containing protein [Chloroflexia bacterium]|nr:GAF domain-containing protein [Chloroflexia bacterium]
MLINISKVYDIMQGIFFVKDQSDKVFRKKGAYAYYSGDELREFSEEVGLSGQVALNKKLLNISNIPEKYLTVLSGLGKSSPANLLILPVVYKDESIGIIELASFKKFDSLAEEILSDFMNQINEKLSKLSIQEDTVK